MPFQHRLSWCLETERRAHFKADNVFAMPGSGMSLLLKATAESIAPFRCLPGDRPGAEPRNAATLWLAWLTPLSSIVLSGPPRALRRAEEDPTGRTAVTHARNSLPPQPDPPRHDDELTAVATLGALGGSVYVLAEHPALVGPVTGAAAVAALVLALMTSRRI
ncbi:hypothetical protein [Streptomyces sp. SPB074]|uniref:hypothetical protein n=1 Tax=Streptomyces sp. (strain SPB074) TaxID=465543 RepID=UPI00017FE942|nr:hypothetical protein [Streptomyces sp. SPB074]EDY43216.1 hypothetical protein SSBG_01178 [Streptomyces sp. SPB074]